MISKEQIKSIRKLEQKKYRDKTGTFIAEGPKVLVDFVTFGMQPLALFGTKNFFSNNQKIFSYIPAERKTIVSETELKKISLLASPHEALGIFPIPANQSFLNFSGKMLFLILENISDPGNMGTIIRIAAWFGFAIVASPQSVDFYNPKVVQASMGALAAVKFFTEETETAVMLLSNKMPVYAAVPDGKNIYEEKIPFPCAVVIGNESAGVSENILKMVSGKISIPAFSHGIDSLNAAVSAGIICSEIRRKNSSTADLSVQQNR